MKTPIALFILLFFHIGVYCQTTSGTLQTFDRWQLKQVGQYQQRLNTDDTAYASAINRLAGLYRSMGSYEKAEMFYRDALKIRERSLGKNHPDYAVSLNNLALLQKDMGNFRKAEELYLEAIEILKRTFGKKNLSYATTLSNLATLYRDFEKYSDAQPLYIEALALFIDILGEKKHASYGITLNNLAVMFRDMGNYTAAEPLQNRAVEILSSVPGKTHPSYATALNNLAMLHKKTGDYSTAETLFVNALNIRQKTLGKYHPSYANSLDNLAELYYISGKHEVADSFFVKANNVIFYNIRQQFGFLSEKEKELYLKTFSGRFDAFQSYSLIRQSTNPSIVGETYNSILKTKGLLLKSGTAMRNTILSSNDGELIGYYENWIHLKRQITHLTVSGIPDRDTTIALLEKQANDLEKMLVRKSAEFNDLENMFNISWHDVKNELSEGEAAIEFSHFFQNTDSILYCALIVKHDSDYPLMVPLFEEKELRGILSGSPGNNQKHVNAIYGKHSKPVTKLYQLIWQPVEKHIDDVNTLYISPSGLLHKISFAAISSDVNRYLLDDYHIRMLSTTAKTGLSTRLDFSSDHNVTLFGGINYSIGSEANKPWLFLGGTLEEIKTIDTALHRHANVKLVSGEEATVAKFKNIASTSHILHIATHGFFFAEPEQEHFATTHKLALDDIEFRGKMEYVLKRYVNNPDPLMRSGLVFAGVNDYWTGHRTINDDKDDGVLTALEVINIDLRQNKLTVMSACETGLGDIVGREGVYGLQRAFKMAGTDNQIISLWQIPDKETAEFMQTFYGQLIEKNDMYEAFLKTQKIMRKKYDPFFWAAFVLIQ